MRDTKGRFALGNPGGPGRPKGVTSAQEFRRKVGEEDLQRIIARVVQAAIDGDMAAARIVLDRLYPLYDARSAELLERLAELEAALDAPRAA